MANKHHWIGFEKNLLVPEEDYSYSFHGRDYLHYHTPESLSPKGGSFDWNSHLWV